MPIAATEVTPRSINVPGLPEDFLTQQQCRLLWDQISLLQAKTEAQETTIANLITAANTLESELVALKQACAASGIF